MSEPAQKCENNECYFNQNYTENCLFLIKYLIIAVLALGEIWNFQISSKKSFITSTLG